MKKPLKLVPRNPHVAPSRFRKAGSHGKSGKARRREEKIKFRKSLDPNENSVECLRAANWVLLIRTALHEVSQVEIDQAPCDGRLDLERPA